MEARPVRRRDRGRQDLWTRRGRRQGERDGAGAGGAGAPALGHPAVGPAHRHGSLRRGERRNPWRGDRLREVPGSGLGNRRGADPQPCVRWREGRRRLLCDRSRQDGPWRVAMGRRERDRGHRGGHRRAPTRAVAEADRAHPLGVQAFLRLGEHDRGRREGERRPGQGLHLCRSPHGARRDPGGGPGRDRGHREAGDPERAWMHCRDFYPVRRQGGERGACRRSVGPGDDWRQRAAWRQHRANRVQHGHGWPVLERAWRADDHLRPRRPEHGAPARRVGRY